MEIVADWVIVDAPVKVCKECKHVQFIKGPLYPVIYFCNAPQNEVGVNPVSGGKRYRAHQCTDQRFKRVFFHKHYCGPDAVWFEPKETDK